MSEDWEIHLLNGARKGERFPLVDETVSIGRSRKNNLVIDDPLVSARHLTIHVEKDKIAVEDTGSTHGSLLNGKGLKTRSEIKHGDVVQIGDQKVEILSLSVGADDDRTIFVDPAAVQAKLESGGDASAAGVSQASTPGTDPQAAGTGTRILADGRTRILTAEERPDERPLAARLRKIPSRYVLSVVIGVLLGGLLLVLLTRSTGSDSQDGGPSTATRWEYKTVKLPLASDRAAVADEAEWDSVLNSMGQEGWELVQGVGDTGRSDASHVVVIFKRGHR